MPWMQCAVGKAVLMNPNFATFIKQGREAEIEVTLDATNPAKYRFSDYLWQAQQQVGA